MITFNFEKISRDIGFKIENQDDVINYLGLMRDYFRFHNRNLTATQEDFIRDFAIIVDAIEKKNEEENIMTNYINTMKIGDIFHNDNGEDYLILSIDSKNDYILLFRAKNKLTPFIWAYGIRGGSWVQGHYFKDIHDAMDYYNNMNKPETFTVHIYDEDELIDMTTFSNCLDAIQYAIETAAHEVVNDKTGEVVYRK